MNKYINSITKISQFMMDVKNTSKPRVGYIGGCPKYPNLGDVALFEAYKNIFDLKYNLLWYPGGRGVYYPSLCGIFSGCGILAGGTLINRWLAPLECVNIFDKLIVFGTGVAIKDFWVDNKYYCNVTDGWIKFLNKCNYIGVRGPLSLMEMNKNGIKADIIGDPVLNFSIDNPVINNSKYNKTLGLNIGWDMKGQWGYSEYIFNEYINFAKMALRKGWEVTWFIVCPSDVEMTREIAKASKTESNIIYNYNDPYNYIKQINKQSVFLGMRLHSVVLATCAYVPSIMVEYRPKCRDFMLSIGCEDSIIRTDKINSDIMLDMLYDKYNNRYNESCRIYESVSALKIKQLNKSREIKLSLNI